MRLVYGDQKLLFQQSDTRHLGQHACRQELEHLVETATFPLLQDNVDGVKGRVERRVQGQHEDGHGHVDLPGDVQAAGSEEAQNADGEPTQEIRHGHGDQAPRDLHFLVLLVSAGHRRVAAHRPGIIETVMMMMI